ncbi:hypothetical protein EJD04_26360 [Salmonella enterica]|nr:hypothetical protein [Salmonella enterica]
MTAITREQQKQILIDTANHVISRDNTSPYSENLRELARIALASLTAEPVAWTDEEELRDLRKVGFCEMFSVEPISKDADMLRVIPLYRHAQPVSVVPDGLRQALSNAGIAAPESDEMLAATCEKYIQMLVTWVKDRKPFQPAPVMPVVQCPFPCGWDSLNELVVQDAAVVVRGLMDGEVVTEANRQAVIANNDRLLRVIAACRSAMLNGGKS